MATWMGPKEPEFTRPSFLQSVRLILRLTAFVTGMIILMLLFWLSRAVEFVIGGRRASNFIIWIACVMSCWLLGLKVETVGTPMARGGARVCNHSSWADIFVLRAASQIFFVAKSEVRSWPVLGFIAAQTGTMFIARKRTEAKRQEEMFKERLRAAHRLCFFPEGTSSDGMRVLPFKSTLFAAFLADELKEEIWVQPVTVFYQAASHLPVSFYGWWGTIDFGPHLLNVLAKSTGGGARVHFHEPVRAADFENRKALSAYCEDKVRGAHDAEMARTGTTAPQIMDAYKSSA